MLLLGGFSAFAEWEWVPSEERFEIKDNTGILNLRILEDENKMLTIGEDNTLKTYNYTTGELENSCQCQPDSNVVYRNISSDGKTAVLVSERDFLIQIFEFNNCEMIRSLNVTIDLIYYDLVKYLDSGIRYIFLLDYSINYANYFYETQRFNVAIKTRFLFDNPASEREDLQQGIFYEFDLSDTNKVEKSMLITGSPDFIIDNVEKNNISYFMLGNQIKSDAHYLDTSITAVVQSLVKITTNPLNIQTLRTYKLDTIRLRYLSYPILNGFIPNYYNIQYLNNKNELLLQKTDSVELVKIDDPAQITKEISYFSNIPILTSRFHQLYYYIDSESLRILPANSKVILTQQKITNKNRNSDFNIDENIGSITFSTKSNNIIKYIVPDIIQDTPLGFSYSKDTIFVGDSIEFISLIDAQSYKWELFPDSIEISNSQKFTYQFNKSGLYSVKLTATYADGSSREFLKEDIIEVWNEIEPFFEAEIIKNSPPYIIKYTDKSKGHITEWKWNLREGRIRYGQEVYDTLSFASVLSPKLTTSNNKMEQSKFKLDYIKLINDTIIYKDYTAGIELFDRYSIAHSANNICAVRLKYKDCGRLNNFSYGIFYDVYLETFDFDLNYKSETLVNDSYTSTDFCDEKNINIWLNLAKLNHKIFDFNDYYLYLQKSYNEFSKYTQTTIPELSETHKFVMNTSAINITEEHLYVARTATLGVSEIIKSDIDFNINWRIKLDGGDFNNFKFQELWGLTYIFTNTDKGLKVFEVNDDGNISERFDFQYLNNFAIENVIKSNEHELILCGSLNDSTTKQSIGYLLIWDVRGYNIIERPIPNYSSLKKITNYGTRYWLAVGENTGTQGYLVLSDNFAVLDDIRYLDVRYKIQDFLVKDNEIFILRYEDSFDTLDIPFLRLNRDLTTDYLTEFKYNYLNKAPHIQIIKDKLPEYIILSLDLEEQVSTNNTPSLHIYPNPALEYIKLEYFGGDLGAHKIEIYNYFGERIIESDYDGVSIQQIDTSHLPSGVYYAKIGNVTNQFVIVR